jgi:NitT/TauT family transport system permease protein
MRPPTSAAQTTGSAIAPAGATPEPGRGARHLVRTVALGAIAPLGLLVFWHLMVRWTGTRLIPAPRDVAVTMWDFAVGGIYDDAYSASLPVHLWKSVQRVYGGFFCAALVGVPLGLAIGRLPAVRAMLDPTLSLLRPVPVTAWLPLSMIFFGLGPKSAVFLVFLGAFYPILLNTILGVKSVDPRLFEAAEMLGCRGSRLFRAVVFPAALPSIFTGLRLGAGFAWLVIVVGEMTGVPEGLGAVIMDGRTLSRTDLVITGMILIGVAGFVSDRILLRLNNHFLRWSPQHHA